MWGNVNIQASSPPMEGKPGSSIKRQAVVVIHGIGNQRPMDTLRPFVDAVLNVDPAHDEVPKYYSKPEHISGTFELRRLQSTNSRPRTDYFELYWQHLVPTATWQRIFSWLRLLLTRRPSDVPPSLRAIWIFSWLVVVAALGLLALDIVPWLFPNVVAMPAWLANWSGLPLGVSLALLTIQGLVLNYVGDAAIYLSPDPANIQARQAVREAGVALIEQLHNGRNEGPKYDRIVMVGHSLGSIIGYDILTYAWPRYNSKHSRPAQPTRDALQHAETAARRLWEANSSDKNALEGARKDWVAASRHLWLEQRKNGLPWLVTDFITLGSPLAHSLLLLARNKNEFDRKKKQRELPTSPPQLEKDKTFSFRNYYTIENNAQRTAHVLHHAAPFAVTNWTNLYFPARFVLKGDFIGGPIADYLGPGIVDIPVRTATWGGWLAHTHYWRPHRTDRADHMSAMSRLIAALDIERNRSFGPESFGSE